MSDRVRIYRDQAGEYRWKRQSENGEEVSESGEGYENESHAIFMAHQLNSDADVRFDVEGEQHG